MPARRKITDRVHKKIIARYAECQNYSQVASEFHVSETTIRRHVKGDSETAKKVAQKKEQNTLDMLQYMDTQKESIQKLLTNIVNALDDPEKLKRANVRDLATAYGIIYDKIMQSVPKDNDELLQKARDILGDINGVIK